ncbi:unnamed protein product [Cochlearia groenlandica]
MADNTSPIASPPLFLEVFCEVSGKNYRFTSGTKAEFAVSVINRKLGSLKSKVVYIEAVKKGEEPISFGDDAFLVSYGVAWKLKTVVDSDFTGTEKKDVPRRHLPRQFPSVSSTGSKEESKSTWDSREEVEGGGGDKSMRYMGRIFVAIVLMFVLGGIFTTALENLPRLILLFNNYYTSI